MAAVPFRVVVMAFAVVSLLHCRAAGAPYAVDGRAVKTVYPAKDWVVSDYVVTDFGAKAEPGFDNRAAFQAAIDAAWRDGGGVVYVLDEGNALYRNLNKGQVLMEKVESKFDREELRQMLQDHMAATGSEKARQVLDDFDAYLPRFKKIIPGEYKKLMQLSAQFEEQGMSREEAQIEAFYTSVAGKEG